MSKPTQATVQASVLVVDDILANRNLLRETLEPQGYEVLLAPDGEAALRIAQEAHPDVILLDVIMPKLDGFETCRHLKQNETTRAIPVIFITARDEAESMVAGFQAGGVDYITKPFQAEEVLIRVQTHLTLHRQAEELRRNNQELLAEIERRQQAEAALKKADEKLSLISQQEAVRWGLAGFIGKSTAIRSLLQDVRRLHQFGLNTSVLISGESGTGKELIARAIHYGHPHSKGAFVAVNCSAIPAELVESTLFGHLKGAFTGATSDHQGCFEQANGGTLFLDEIGDMPLAMQAKMLRVLEAGHIVPLGGSQERPIEVRVVAATNAELQPDLAAGKFRRDLFFRLARFTIEVPPLRDRSEDIPLLADHFLGLLAGEMGMPKPRLSSEALALLERYDYPGNIRELKNLIERALIESGGGDVGPEHVRFVHDFRAVFPPSAADPRPTPSPGVSGVGLTPGRSISAEERILAYAAEQGSINNPECRDLLGIGMQRACYLLRKLLLAGRLQRDHGRRWAQYRLPSAGP
jgi:DNA-binding NtrC family response regulator